MNTLRHSLNEEERNWVKTGEAPERNQDGGSNQVQRISILDSKGDPVPFKKLKLRGAPNAFSAKAFFNGFIKMLADEGPAFSKVAFMIGTFAETLYAGWQAGAPSSIQMIGGSVTGQVWLISIIVWGMGLMYETAFAFSWARTGSNKLAGAQVELNAKLFKDCLHLMMGGLVAAIISKVFGAPMILNVWLVIQIIGAVHIIKLQRKIKVSHPTYEARQMQTNSEARWQAAWIFESLKEQELYLTKTEHEREIDRKKLAIRTEEEIKVLKSRNYRNVEKGLAKQRFLTMGKSKGGGLGQRLKQLISPN